MTVNPTTRHALTAMATLLTLASAGTALPARADEMNWRQTSVAVGQEGPTILRAGVAIVNGKQPATVSVRNRMKGPPQDGVLQLATEIQLRFDDGSTIVAQADGQVRLDPQGRPIPGESRSSGKIVSGTGRYAGITGTYEMRVRNDIDPKADGALGDYFATVTATYTLPR